MVRFRHYLFMFEFFKKNKKAKIIDANVLNIIISILLIHPYHSYKRKDLIKILDGFFNKPEEIIGFLTHLGLIKKFSKNSYFVDHENKLIKSQINNIHILDDNVSAILK